MRNCVLTMMGEMIIKVLSKDDIDDKLKSARDDFLDNLEVTFSIAVDQRVEGHWKLQGRREIIIT